MASWSLLLKHETTRAYKIELATEAVGGKAGKQPPRCSPKKLQPLDSKRHRRSPDIDAATRTKWIQEAREQLASSSLLSVMHAHNQDEASLRSISHPVLPLRSELVTQALQRCATHEQHERSQLPYEVRGLSTSSVLTHKIAPRLSQVQSMRLHAIHFKYQLKPLPIDPLVSDEVQRRRVYSCSTVTSPWHCAMSI